MLETTRISPVWRSRLFATLLALYCCWTARESLLLTGLPLGPLGVAACVALALTLILRPPIPPASLVASAAALMIVKAAIVPLLLPSGWAAQYYDGDTFSGAPLKSVDFRGAPWTRLEPELNFEGNSFPLHFFNEMPYNFRPDRRSLAFSATYEGHIHAARAGRLYATVVSTGGFDLLLDGESILSRQSEDPPLARRNIAVPLNAGTRRLLVRHASPSKTPRKLAVFLRVTEADGPTIQRALRVRPMPAAPAQESRSQWLARLLALADAAILLMVGWWAVRTYISWWRSRSAVRPERSPNVATAATLTGLGVLLVLLYVVWQAVPHPFVFIGSGYDAMGYEHYARKMLFGDWLLTGPESGVYGTALFYTAGYHVAMAAVHAVLGESLWRIYFVQDWLLCCTVILSAAAAIRLSGWAAGLIAFVIGLYFYQYVFFPVDYLYRENLVVFMNAGLVFLCLSPAPWSTRRASAVGAVAGFGYLVDPINLGLLPVLVWVVHRMAPPERRWRGVQLFLGVWLLFFALIPLRNFVVTGVPMVLPSEGPASLWYGNQPPPDVYPPITTTHANFHEAVWTYAVKEPRLLATEVTKRVLFSFGFTSEMRVPAYVQFWLIVLLAWVCAAVGTARAVRQNVGIVVLLTLVMGRWATIVLFSAGERYLMALAMLLIPLAAVGFLAVWRSVPVLAVILVAALGIEHYAMTSIELGGVAAWPGGRLIGSASYHTLRQRLAREVPATTRLRWTFPADTSLWKPTQTLGVVDDDTPTYQLLLDDEGVIASPAIDVPAPLVETMEIEAGFTGFSTQARLVWFRPGHAPNVAFFPVDHRGVVRTYRIPVWQSRDWTDTITRIEISYNGDSVEPRRVELVPYKDVVIPTASIAPSPSP